MTQSLDPVDLVRGTLAATGYAYSWNVAASECGFANSRCKRQPAVTCRQTTTHVVVFRNGGRVAACESHAHEFAAQSKSFLHSIERMNGVPAVITSHVDRFADNPFIALIRQSHGSGRPLAVTVPSFHVDEVTDALLNAERKLAGDSIRVHIHYTFDGFTTADLTDIPNDEDAPVRVTFEGY